MSDKMNITPPEGYQLRYDIQTGKPIFVHNQQVAAEEAEIARARALNTAAVLHSVRPLPLPEQQALTADIAAEPVSESAEQPVQTEPADTTVSPLTTEAETTAELYESPAVPEVGFSETGETPEEPQEDIACISDDYAETQAPVSDPSQLTSGNLTPEQKEGLEQNKRSCRHCGEPKSIYHFRPTEDANCPYCGTFVPEGECHDCGNDD
nr:hypothetical protein [Clostridia bacterium]